MTLVRAIGFHWHAVRREVLGLGCRATDMFTPKLAPAEVISMIMAPLTTSALRHEMTQGVSLTDFLSRPYVPVDTRPAIPPDINDHDEPVQHIGLDVMTIEQYEQRRKERLTGV